MAALSYEQRRRLNLEDNKRILAAIGLVNPFKEKGLKRQLVPKPKPVKQCNVRVSEVERKLKRPLVEIQGSVYGTRRKSARLEGRPSLKWELEEEEEEEEEDWEEEEGTKRVVKKKYKGPTVSYHHVKVEKNRPNFYGPVEGVEIGVVWLTRMECCRDGIHRPPVSGIHAGADGAYSIALSGGYDDNVDWGECFTYTGEGGRDLKGTVNKPKNLRQAPQSKDQTLTRGNLALSKNVETGNPVRVIRGYKLNSPFAPEEGYRYDGLYSVEKAWFTTGLAGFGVWKFALRRLEDQAPPPWEYIESSNTDMANNNNKSLRTEVINQEKDMEADFTSLKNKVEEADGEELQVGKKYQDEDDNGVGTDENTNKTVAEIVENKAVE